MAKKKKARLPKKATPVPAKVGPPPEVTVEELQSRSDQLLVLWGAYLQSSERFRASIAKDMTQLREAHENAAQVVHRINASYAMAIATLGSHDVVRAISNAERLLACMKELSEAKPQSFSVTFGQP